MSFSTSIQKFLDDPRFVLTGSRALLNKEDRDWDFICHGRPTESIMDELDWRHPATGQKEHIVIYDVYRLGFHVSWARGNRQLPGNYRDMAIDELWTHTGITYKESVHIQVCNNEWNFADKCDVNQFLIEKSNDDLLRMRTYFGWHEVWNNLMGASYEYMGMDNEWRRMSLEISSLEIRDVLEAEREEK